MLRFIRLSGWITQVDRHFNTSHVTVYRTLSKRYSLHRSNFNTSHVTVYLHRIHTKKCLLCNFNTSHVTVYHYSVEICQAGRKISIHPMLRFIADLPTFKESSKHFNTSHVTVYLMILSHFYLGIFHHFLYFTSFQHFLPADYKI